MVVRKPHSDEVFIRFFCAYLNNNMIGSSGSEKVMGSSSNLTFLDFPKRAKSDLFALRKQNFAEKLSVSYSDSDPLWIVKGDRQYLEDEAGERYLDTRNNVAHVGHTHPEVVHAVCRQVECLNTNTRYLHENIVELSERLLDTFSERTCRRHLTKVFFVNSGSEANDLALRLAECFTKRKAVVSVEHAYHGHTAAAVDISPYKFMVQKRSCRRHYLSRFSCKRRKIAKVTRINVLAK